MVLAYIHRLKTVKNVNVLNFMENEYEKRYSLMRIKGSLAAYIWLLQSMGRIWQLHLNGWNYDSTFLQIMLKWKEWDEWRELEEWNWNHHRQHPLCQLVNY